MSDRYHRQQPSTLPEGYQFGDARPEPVNLEGATITIGDETYVLGPEHKIVPDGVLMYELQTHDWMCALPYGRCTCGADPEGHITPAQRIPYSWRAPHENDAAQLRRRQAEVIELGIVGTATTDEEKKAVALGMQVLPSIQRMLNDEELKAKIDRMYYDGASLRDTPGFDWLPPTELRCPECGQPSDIFHRRTRVDTDPSGRTHVVSEPVAYCPSAFHFDFQQRTGDETV